MTLQDLTPQLRTRLSRLERLVGLFVTAATLLMLAGLGYYVYHLAETKGWFKTKAPYFTYLETGAGVKAGDKVRLMGFPAGEITSVEAEDPDKHENVVVEFVMFQPYYGYVWDDSIVKVRSAGLLGARYLEVTKGGTRVTNDVHATFKEENRKLVGAWSRTLASFTNWHKGDGPWQLFADEPPELSSQLDQMVAMLKVSLTNILQLTNALTKTLSNAVEVTANFNEVLLDSKSLVRNARDITDNLKGPRGSLGEWLIPTNLNLQLQQALLSANTVLTNANLAVTNTDARLGVLVGSLNQSLENLANLTSNLNAQVQVNSNLVSSITHAIVHSDELVQGLKRHWLLRSAFKEKRTNQPPERARDRAKSPKEAGGR